MQVWLAEEARPRRRVRWLRPACLAVVLALTPLSWWSGACNSGGPTTGAHAVFRDGRSISVSFGLAILGLASVWVAPRVIPWLRLLLDLLSAAALAVLSCLLVLEHVFSPLLPAGVAALGGLVVAFFEALFRAGGTVRDLWRARKARSYKTRDGPSAA